MVSDRMGKPWVQEHPNTERLRDPTTKSANLSTTADTSRVAPWYDIVAGSAVLGKTCVCPDQRLSVVHIFLGGETFFY